MDKEELLAESETVRHRRMRNQEKWPQFQTFLFDNERQKVLGSSGVDWRKLFSFRFYQHFLLLHSLIHFSPIESTVVYYTFFYVGVLFFFTVLLGVFALILDEITPHWKEENSPMQGFPGSLCFSCCEMKRASTDRIHGCATIVHAVTIMVRFRSRFSSSSRLRK